MIFVLHLQRTNKKTKMSEEKLYVRMCERYTIWEASEPIEVNVETLRKCTPAYEGETAADLLEYLEDIRGDYDWYEENMEHFDDEDEAYQLIFDEQPEMEVYSDSRSKEGVMWLDVGKPNDEWRKYGGFEVMETSVY